MEKYQSSSSEHMAIKLQTFRTANTLQTHKILWKLSMEQRNTRQQITEQYQS